MTVASPPSQVQTEVLTDTSRTILTRNDSPDVSFDYSLNPYRGCEHGCTYCFARPGHETLGYSCGLDFETRIIAKPDAPALLRKALTKPSWRGETIVLSTITDCYQPVESKMQITRQCLEVMVAFRQPVSIITKSRLVLRDLDLLEKLAAHGAVSVAISLTSLNNELSRKLEPRAASPRDRLWTIRRLASAGIPVTVMVAPVIPAINDREIPKLLEAAADAGATRAQMVLLRLPHQVDELFVRWLQVHMPDRAEHVLRLVREARGGKLYDAQYGARMRGVGAYAEHLRQTFSLFSARFGLSATISPLNSSAFRRPTDAAQMRLFDAL